MNTVDQSCWPDIFAHAMAEYPRECVGLLIDGYVKDCVVGGQYVPLKNIAETPETHGRMAKRDLEEYHGRITAIVHSHPNGPDCPSGADMQSQMAWQIPWIIVSTNGKNCRPPFAFGDEVGPLPLENRPFRHGVTDCWDAIRSYFDQKKGIKLKNQPRDWGWWNLGENIYMDGVEGSGFTQISANNQRDILAQLQPDDVYLLYLRSDVPNHGGVYLGEGLGYHHLGSDRAGPYSPNTRSKIESIVRWVDYRPLIFRYGLHEDHQDTRSAR